MSRHQSSSPYAAPHTPIASAKRARTIIPNATRPLNSPLKENRRVSPSSLEDEEDDDDVEIFSPALHADGGHADMHHHADGQIHSHHHPEHNVYEETEVADQNAAEDETSSHEEEEEEFNPFLFIKTLPEYSSVRINGKICLPPSQMPGKLTLALDLDETLVHCTVDPIPKPDHVFSVKFNENNYQVYVKKRPYLDYFLESVSRNFEVIVFTASQQVYADRLLDLLDIGKCLVHHRLFRESCLQVQGNYLKDLNVLGRELATTVLVDNSPHAYGYQVDNGIPIESWFDDETDTELLKLSGFLRKLHNVSDVRPIIREHFNTYKLVERAGVSGRRSTGGSTP